MQLYAVHGPENRSYRNPRTAVRSEKQESRSLSGAPESDKGLQTEITTHGVVQCADPLNSSVASRSKSLPDELCLTTPALESDLELDNKLLGSELQDSCT